MSELVPLMLVVFSAGGVGGITNALMTDNGFILPRTEKANQVSIVRPGFLVNVFVGGVAACISWGLYGPFASAWLIGGPTDPNAPKTEVGITPAALVGAILVGIGGARWLTNEVDKTLLRGAAVNAAKAPEKRELAEAIAIASPGVAFRIAGEK